MTNQTRRQDMIAEPQTKPKLSLVTRVTPDVKKIQQLISDNGRVHVNGKQIAKRFGIDKTVWWSVCRNKGTLKTEKLAEIATALRVDINTLFEGGDQPENAVCCLNGRRVERARRHAELIQRQLSEAFGCGVTTWSRLEADTRVWVRNQVAAAIAAHLGVPLAEIAAKDHEGSPQQGSRKPNACETAVGPARTAPVATALYLLANLEKEVADRIAVIRAVLADEPLGRERP